jgi:HK97 family phage prohead protease
MPYVNEHDITGAEYKAMQGQVNVDEAQGIVECFAAGLGNKDSVGDICLPGCFTESLKRRKPRVVWGHNWNEPIGKVLEIYEVGPNDPRLPMKMKRAGIGGLYAKVQFNLKSERGRQAFADVSFFGEEQEWSIGYKTLNADYDSQRQANLLREVELYEVSPVLHGANQLTGTISIKSDDPYADDFEPEYDEKGERLRDPKGGLTAAGRRHFARTEGANLKPGVKGPADTPDKMRRKGSFLTRFFTNPSGPMKDENGEPTRLALSAAAWGEPVPQNMDDASELAAKGRRLLERYNAQKEKGDYPTSIYRAEQEERDEDEDYTGPRGPDGGVPAANPAMGRAGNLARALAMRFGGAVRLRNADPNMAIFDHMDKQGTKQTLRVTYHFDGDEFMFGNPVKVRQETVYLPVEKPDVDIDDAEEMPNRRPSPITQQYQREMEEYPALPRGVKPKMCGCGCMGRKEEEEMPEEDLDMKAPQDAILDIPQEQITGDIMRGYGPRRGNLERLLRYWRPIMKKPGGFRRCRVILADHPELYPLNNICAWLHHETTGLWPNEGCHHPGMKNCRKKIRGIRDGSIFSDREFNDRLESAFKKGDAMEDMEFDGMSDEDMEKSAMAELKAYFDGNPEMKKYINDDANWEHDGEDEKGGWVVHMPMGMGKPMNAGKPDCGCGCDGEGSCGPKPAMPVMRLMNVMSELEKSISEEMQTKAGRVISNRNMQKLQQAMELLQEVVTASKPSDEPVVQVKSNGMMRITAPIDSLFEVKSLIDPIINFHGIDAEVNETGIYFGSSVSTEAKSAMINAISAYKDSHKQDNH